MSQRRPEVAAGVADRDLSDLTAVVTGSTSGVGRETALALGRCGASVLVHGRDESAGEAVRSQLEAETDAANAWFVPADFASLSAVVEAAETIRASTDTIDILYNNAGGLFPRAGTTEDGVAYTFGVNHLAPFVLTHHLYSHLTETARIVTTASEAHRGVSLDLDALERPERGTGGIAYARSKLANVLFTRELARRSPELTAVSVHPGAIPGSGFARHLPGPLSTLIGAGEKLPGPIRDRLFDTPADGAAALLHAGLADGITNGAYYSQQTRNRPGDAARDPDSAAALWRTSETMVDRRGISLPEL